MADPALLSATIAQLQAAVASPSMFRPMWSDDRMDREQLPPGVWHAVALRDRYRCGDCGDPTGGADAEVDHIVPVAGGGVNRTDNLRLLCKPCNQRKSNLATLALLSARPVLIVLECQDCSETPGEDRTQWVFCATHRRRALVAPSYAQAWEFYKHAALIAACSLCNATGHLPNGPRCSHDPATYASAEVGLAACRAALSEVA